MKVKTKPAAKAKKAAPTKKKAPLKPVKKASPKAKAAPAKKKTTPKKVVKAVSKPVKKTVVKKVSQKVSKEVKGLPEFLRDAALKVLDERQAKDIVTIDLRGRSAIADYAIVASGGSARQLAAIADYMREAFFKLGVRRTRVEGLPQGDWVLVDAGDLLIHLFRPEVRSFYHIEDIWSVTKKPLA